MASVPINQLINQTVILFKTLKYACSSRSNGCMCEKKEVSRI